MQWIKAVSVMIEYLAVVSIVEMVGYKWHLQKGHIGVEPRGHSK